MTDHEKSVKLARLCGWEMDYRPNPNGPGLARLLDTGGNVLRQVEFGYPAAYPSTPNLYDPANMALAWRVLNWALQQNQPTRGDLDDLWKMPFGDELFAYVAAISPRDDGLSIFELPPAEAQRAWLDKILELAEAGMVSDD